MTSEILNMIGLGNLDIAFLFIGLLVIVIILVILIIIQMIKTKKLVKKYRIFMTGKNGKSLENEMILLFEDIKFLKNLGERNKKDIQNLYNNMELAYQKIGLVKYDAFKEMGGRLSFSLALLNDQNDGFIMNSVHGSDGCYSYTKSITKGECDIQLGDEERVALEKAINCNKKSEKYL